MEEKNALTIPVAIIVAGALVAGAVLYTNRSGTTPQVANIQTTEGEIAPITAEDHILGNPEAPIKIVEYSDTSCPFCKRFHPTLRQIMDEYGKDGRVAWVYRHFPLDQLHPNAKKEAEGLECVNELGGNAKFWEYTHLFYDTTQSDPNGLPLSEQTKLAKSIGIDGEEFESCVASGKFTEKIQAQYNDAFNAGVMGTPFSFIITPSGSKVPINGALPYTDVKRAIDALLAESN